MGVALRQAEQAAENRASSHPASTAGVQIRVDKEEYIGLRWAAAYWKARHGEAVQREADLKADLPPRTSPPSKLDSEPFEVHSKG